MELVLTNRARLKKAYGETGWMALQSAIDDYLDALSSVGIDANLFLLDELTPNAETDPKEFKIALRVLQHKHAARYLVFLGGHEVIPFYQRPDGTADELVDHQILSDTYYVDFDESEYRHWPEMAVGRLPDAGSIDFLIDQLRRAAAVHSAGGIPMSGYCIGFSADVWKTASKQTYCQLDQSVKTLKFCPPVGCKTSALTGVTEILNINDLPSSGILYFNVHGHRRNPLWWGGQLFLGFPDPRAPLLIDHKTLSKANLTDSIILCEACYGAAIHGHTTEDSLPLCALKRGALAFFGCSNKSYAVTQREGKPSGVSGIDALFQSLIYNVIEQKVRFGSALSEAKKRHSAFHNAYDEKNVLSLMLLGDPMLRFR
jgi:Peptidase family C25